MYVNNVGEYVMHNNPLTTPPPADVGVGTVTFGAGLLAKPVGLRSAGPQIAMLALGMDGLGYTCANWVTCFQVGAPVTMSGPQIAQLVFSSAQPSGGSQATAGVRWSRFFEQNFRVDKWSLCRG